MKSSAAVANLSRQILGVLLLACALARAAALVPVPGPTPPLPVGGLEANRGQAKPEILFLNRGSTNLAFTTQSVLFSPLGVQQSFVASNPAPVVRFLDPLPGVVNSFAGSDARNWFTGIPRFATAQLAGIYPGIEARYTAGINGDVTLQLILDPGIRPDPIVFEIARSLSMTRSTDGSLVVRLGPSKYDAYLLYAPPTAIQETPSGRVSRNVSFKVQSTTRFGFEVESQDSSARLQIEMKLPAGALFQSSELLHKNDAAGNRFVAVSIPDAAGKDDPYPSNRWEGCGEGIGYPIPCSDVAIYKFSKAGDLLFTTYLAGKTRDAPTFLGIAPGGALVVTGGTDSSDFPVTASAAQPVYAGPVPLFGTSSSPTIGGDFFAAKLDPGTGALTSSTFLGGPNADNIGDTALGSDGSVYFFPKWLVQANAQMPVTSGAFQSACQGEPCQNGYAAHLSPSLDRLLYGTYLPGSSIIGELHTDGSVYFTGWAAAGFPTTPGAYQPQAAGKEDGILARLNPQGTGLLFGTYIGGPDTDWILRMAVAPDGSVWGSVSSFVTCCVDIDYRLVHLDSTGSRLLADKPIDVGDLAMDRDGNLFATAAGNFTTGPDAFLANACGPAYLKLNAAGAQLFATYLPSGFSYDFNGTSDHGTPLVRGPNGDYEVVEGLSMGVFTGCVVDGASFGNADILSPGAIVTLFGSRMGPRQGVEFKLENGHVPTTVAGTRVLVDGEPVPILYASYWQINVVLPYSLPVGSRPTIQVVSDDQAGNTLASSRVQSAGISIFRQDASPTLPAAALNEDGTVNSPRNPAKRGSRVMLFGTGGGATNPASVAGKVTPLSLRLLVQQGVEVRITSSVSATVEFAGAAPGLVAGVTQINIKLPDTIPTVDGLPKGLVPLYVSTPMSFYPGYVTVAVE